MLVTNDTSFPQCRYLSDEPECGLLRREMPRTVFGGWLLACQTWLE